MFKGVQDNELELVKYYLRSGINPNYQHPEYMALPLAESIRYTHIEMAELLLSNGANPSIREMESGLTPLALAEKLGHDQFVELLSRYCRETHFDKWMYVFTHLSRLQDRPKKLQERIFAKLFEAAEIAKFSPKEREAYEESLKYYRDIKNVVDTSKEEGIKEGIEKTAKKMKDEGEPIEKIMKYTNLSKEAIERL